MKNNPEGLLAGAILQSICLAIVITVAVALLSK